MMRSVKCKGYLFIIVLYFHPGYWLKWNQEVTVMSYVIHFPE